MPPLKSNKLIPIIAAGVLGLSVLTFWRMGRSDAVSAGDGLSTVPGTPKADKKGPFGTSAPKPAADADTPNETIKTLTAQVNAMRTDMQSMRDDQTSLKNRMEANNNAGGVNPQANPQPSGGTNNPVAPLDGNPPGDAGKTSDSGSFLGKKLTDLLPGFPGGSKNGGSVNPATMGSANGTGNPGNSGESISPPEPRVIYPAGYAKGKAQDGRETWVKVTPTGQEVTDKARTSSYAQQANASSSAQNTAMIDPANGSVQGTQTSPNAKGKDKPFWTIPENATLMGSTAMTAIVGRVPVDGRVQDPMQFKLILGPTNLAANGHFLPPDLAGIVLSGIAIGDMTLSCSEGVIQSLTFVFNDGTIRTVSLGAGGGNAGGQAASSGTSNMAKLGFLSDRYGNPCISGRFVTNAPAYLTDVVGLKALSIAGKAAASSQTSTNTNALGTSSSTVTGNKGSYILGETMSGATDSVTDWLTRRMGNSFDAVVTPAGAEVVIHITREIAIDKAANARKLDYGRIDSVSSRTHKESRHGLD